MKKIFTLVAMACMALGAMAQTEWNFSTWAMASFAETTTIDGLTIYAAADAGVTIDGNNKTVDGVSYTQRLKLGGAGVFDESTAAPTARVLEFDVTGACSIYVAAMSSSSSAIDRVLVACAGNKDNKIGEFTVPGPTLGSYTYNYTGSEATKIYLYSMTGGINIYDIKVTAGSSAISNIAADAQNANAPVYNLAGQRVGKDAKGILIQNGKKFVR